MGRQATVRTLEEFQRRYYPQTRDVDPTELSPRERGELLAKEVLQYFIEGSKSAEGSTRANR